eukprot:m51a1_g14343 hypothetical protein (651) ;mRNA; f:162898-165558
MAQALSYAEASGLRLGEGTRAVWVTTTRVGRALQLACNPRLCPASRLTLSDLRCLWEKWALVPAGPDASWLVSYAHGFCLAAEGTSVTTSAVRDPRNAAWRLVPVEGGESRLELASSPGSALSVVAQAGGGTGLACVGADAPQYHTTWQISPATPVVSLQCCGRWLSCNTQCELSAAPHRLRWERWDIEETSLPGQFTLSSCEHNVRLDATTAGLVCSRGERIPSQRVAFEKRAAPTAAAVTVAIRTSYIGAPVYIANVSGKIVGTTNASDSTTLWEMKAAPVQGELRTGAYLISAYTARDMYLALHNGACMRPQPAVWSLEHVPGHPQSPFCVRLADRQQGLALSYNVVQGPASAYAHPVTPALTEPSNAWLVDDNGDGTVCFRVPGDLKTGLRVHPAQAMGPRPVVAVETGFTEFHRWILSPVAPAPPPNALPLPAPAQPAPQALYQLPAGSPAVLAVPAAVPAYQQPQLAPPGCVLMYAVSPAPAPVYPQQPQPQPYAPQPSPLPPALQLQQQQGCGQGQALLQPCAVPPKAVSPKPPGAASPGAQHKTRVIDDSDSGAVLVTGPLMPAQAATPGQQEKQEKQPVPDAEGAQGAEAAQKAGQQHKAQEVRCTSPVEEGKKHKRGGSSGGKHHHKHKSSKGDKDKDKQ